MGNAKIKVLLLQNTISKYREEIYNLLSDIYDLTVAYNLNNETSADSKFKTKSYESFNVGPFVVFERHFYLDLKKYDVVITINDLHQLSYCLIPFLPHKNKTICWSMGVRASYTRPYDLCRKHTLLDKLFALVMNKCDSIVFYMEQAKAFWTPKDIDDEKVFIAINTVKVEYPISLETEKTDFIFIGTLYKQKGVDKLINDFAEVIQSNNTNAILHIVGDGDQKKILQSLVMELGIEQNVIFHGAIYDEFEISKLFCKSILCLSPTQAGLSVPKSLGYGVPFVTKRDAITGGEIYHIVNGENGIMYDNQKDLKEILQDAIKNKYKYIEMGKKARIYYLNNATPMHMLKGFIDAINYVLEN